MHPLGPIFIQAPLRRPIASRCIALVVTTAGIVLFLTARWLTPDASGLGTHQQFGLAPCPSPMILGIPCPTCGMTTAFSYAARGRIPAAFRAQPAGLLLALLAASITVFSLTALISGRITTINWYRIDPIRVVWIGVMVLAAAWVYKIFTWP